MPTNIFSRGRELVREVIAPVHGDGEERHIAYAHKATFGWSIDAQVEAGWGEDHARIVLAFAKVWRDEAGFAGRDWRVSDLMFETVRNGIYHVGLSEDQFSTRQEAVKAILARMAQQARFERREAIGECSAQDCAAFDRAASRVR